LYLFFYIRRVPCYINVVRRCSTVKFMFFAQILHSFIHQWLYSYLLGPGLFFSFVIFFTQILGLLGLVISPSQGRCLHAGQHKHRTYAYTECLQWDSNPQLQRSSERRQFMPYTARPLRSAFPQIKGA
jgi:hypothetical protein